MAKKNWEKVFENYKKVKFDDIKEYVEQEQPQYKATLKGLVTEKKSFLVIKKEFFKEFFPQLLPTRKEEPGVPMSEKLKDW